MFKKGIQIGLLSFTSLFSTYAAANNGSLLDLLSFNNSNNSGFNTDNKIKILSAKAPSLNQEVLKLGLQAYNKARQQGLDQKELLTIVDYSKPSTEPRLWVFDLKSNNVLFSDYVAHGKNSGDVVPTSFSNAPSSLKSSLGVFVTKQTYFGKHGYSLRLNGLEQGINDMAANRAIVVHPANYVGAEIAKRYGRLGRTWGCFGLSPKAARLIIDTIKGGTVIFAYYPDRNWLKLSKYLS